MAYKTRHVYCIYRNPIKGARYYQFQVASRQEWQEEDGSRTVEDAWDEMPYEAHPRKGKKIGDVFFTISGIFHPEPHQSRAYIAEQLIGRYKSLEDALATLRDMGVIDDATSAGDLKKYTRSE